MRRRIAASWLLLVALAGKGDATSHTTVTYAKLSSSTRCETDGYADILTNAGCEAAATALSLSDTTVCGT